MEAYIKALIIALYCHICDWVDSKIKSVQRTIEFRQKSGFITSEGEPIMCTYCGCRRFQDKVVGTVASLDAEIEVKCANCDTINGFWAYGYYVW